MWAKNRELVDKGEGEGHTHYPVPSDVSRLRRAIELEKTSGICVFLYLHASKAVQHQRLMELLRISHQYLRFYTSSSEMS